MRRFAVGAERGSAGEHPAALGTSELVGGLAARADAVDLRLGLRCRFACTCHSLVPFLISRLEVACHSYCRSPVLVREREPVEVRPWLLSGRGFETAAAKAGTEGVTFHSMRHAVASRMIARLLQKLPEPAGLLAEGFNRQRTDDQVREAMQSALAL